MSTGVAGKDRGVRGDDALGDRVERVVKLGCVREPCLGRPSARTAAVGLRFGLPLFGIPTTIVEPAEFTLAPGRIVLVTGPSGSGKSTVLARIDEQFAGTCAVERVSFPGKAAIVDRVAPWATLDEAISILTACGLGEARLWVRRFDELSEGERFRARLARAIALQTRAGGVAPLICDEFCSTLHRRAAKAISYNLHKLVTRRNLAVVLACSNEDLIADLAPHTIVRLLGAGAARVEPQTTRAQGPISFRRRLRIERSSRREYNSFAAMHYRATDELGFVDRVFVMRDGKDGDPLGIVVYAHAPLELALRNQATDGLFTRNPKRLNRRLRILRRLVIHPDVRGCGLGYYLVRKTLPLVGTEYVECLASMGEFNPVFQKAGMERIGQYNVPRNCLEALDALRDLDIDPTGREFPLHVCRKRKVRRIVARVVHDWYAAITAGHEDRVERQSPEFLAQAFRSLVGSQPVYYLWKRPRAA